MEKITEKEKRVLQALYKLKNAPIGQVAKETLINRTTLYPILERLVAKGLVSKVGGEGRIVFQPISTEDLKDWVRRKEEESKKDSEDILNWAKTVNSEKGNSLFSDIKYFEGKDGVKHLYSDTWRDNKGKIIYAITDYHSAYETFSDFWPEYWKARVDHGIKVKNIVQESKESLGGLKNSEGLLREMKFIKIFEGLNIEINVYDSKVMIASFDKKNPSGVLIKNEKIASAFKNIFEYLWKSSKQKK